MAKRLMSTFIKVKDALLLKLRRNKINRMWRSIKGYKKIAVGMQNLRKDDEDAIEDIKIEREEEIVEEENVNLLNPMNNKFNDIYNIFREISTELDRMIFELNNKFKINSDFEATNIKMEEKRLGFYDNHLGDIKSFDEVITKYISQKIIYIHSRSNKSESKSAASEESEMLASPSTSFGIEDIYHSNRYTCALTLTKKQLELAKGCKDLNGIGLALEFEGVPETGEMIAYGRFLPEIDRTRQEDDGFFYGSLILHVHPQFNAIFSYNP
ncbi:7991_t:CDS:2 [Funneliformis geosporum]|uniref:10429_t:CDS:1 n=1 Tax=Funneliformis geosporum TaxID=1117311 RepID=A0A9W4SIB7_9GLOM|nr:7991_t:CDS:2 [Funneliformis geosporum]CAI2169584.1 10429_t:CDS:2 [Funneliformis geosporum]